jgi:HEAT repeat protein
MARTPPGSDFDGWVRQLAVPHARQRAKRHLLSAGVTALPALRRGLHDPRPVVRRHCVALLDHLVDEDSVPDLVAALDDDDPEVRARALHALACEACKETACRPADDLFLARAFELTHDPNADLRAAAIRAIGQVALRRSDVTARLAAGAEHERDPGLRDLTRRRVRWAQAADERRHDVALRHDPDDAP